MGVVQVTSTRIRVKPRARVTRRTAWRSGRAGLRGLAACGAAHVSGLRLAIGKADPSSPVAGGRDGELRVAAAERRLTATRAAQRRGRDSNPRTRLTPVTRFPVAPVQPLRH